MDLGRTTDGFDVDANADVEVAVLIRFLEGTNAGCALRDLLTL